MRKIILLLLAIISSVNLNSWAQSRFPIKTSSVWRINYEYPRYEWTTHAIGDEEYTYFIGGDTILAGKNYFKLMKSGILYLETPLIIKNKYIGAIRDSENKFYFVEKNSDAEKVLYDFDAGEGDFIADKNTGLQQVSTIEVLPNGRKKFLFDLITVHCGSANTVIEGIGWLGGLLEGNSCSGHPGVRGSYLACYSENGISQYESDWINQYNLSCSDPTTSVFNVEKQNLKFSISNSTLNAYSPDHSVQIESGEIYNALGTKVAEKKINTLYEFTTNIAFLESGLYVLKISGNRQQSFIFKFVKN